MHLLIVDDDETIRETLALIFDEQAFTIEQAHNGADALDLLCRHPHPTIVLLDQRMPRLDGGGLMRIIRSDPDLADRVEVILMTASAQRISVPVHDLLDDLDALTIAKPFDLDAIEAIVQHAAEKLRAAQVTS